MLTALLYKVQMDKQLSHINATENILRVAENRGNCIFVSCFWLHQELKECIFLSVCSIKALNSPQLPSSSPKPNSQSKRTWMTLFSLRLVSSQSRSPFLT